MVEELPQKNGSISPGLPLKSPNFDIAQPILMLKRSQV
jgi:hypothetical protein